MLILVMGLAAVFATATYFEETTGLLPVGTRAPEFSAKTSDGLGISLNRYLGKKNVVLFFYPKDFTVGCTSEACSMRDGYSDLLAEDAVVFGISRDDGRSHENFRSRYDLTFDLIPDTNRSIIKHYGVERLGGMIGIPKRVTYVIDKKGIIRLVSHHEFSMGDHFADVIQTLRDINAKR